MTMPFEAEAREPFDVYAARQRALTAEYGPPVRPPSFWFMYDNHTFARLKGSADEMGAQIRKHMENDKYCGGVFVRQFPDGPEIAELTFHGDYRHPEKTRIRIAEWVELARLILPDGGHSHG